MRSQVMSSVNDQNVRSNDRRPRWLRWLLFLRQLSTSSDELRSLELLKAHLTGEQRQQFEQHTYFDVIGGTTGRSYRIGKGRVMNVRVLDRRGVWRSCLCFEPHGHLPVGDVMLAQKLALELFEEDALRVANKSYSGMS